MAQVKGSRLALIWVWLGLCFWAWAQPAPSSPTPEQVCRDNLQLLLRSLERYAKDHQNRYPSNLQELVPQYLVQMPRCPLEPDSYTRYSVLTHEPERAFVMCSARQHQLKPPDYLGISSDRGQEAPFAHPADPSICRRTLVQLSQDLAGQRDVHLGYPNSLKQPVRCSCGDPIRYVLRSGGQDYLAYCPGAAHLGSGLAPFSPYVDSHGLHEENLVLDPPRPPRLAPRGLSLGYRVAAGVAVLAIGVVLGSVLRRRRVSLD